MRRTGIALVLALGILVGASGGQAAADVLEPRCAPVTPPTTPSVAACLGWHTSGTKLVWFYDNGTFDAIGGTDMCATHTFTADTTGTQIFCEIDPFLNPGNSIRRYATIKVDSTPPTIASSAPDRPPDFNGWWTHPVTFAFTGTDATSGIASCTSPIYSGPDSATAAVTGSCLDVAGNTTSQTVPLKYDATPPALSNVAASAGDASANVSWTPGADVVSAEVTRTPGDTPGTTSRRVFDGSTASFRDVGLVNGVSYTYSVTAFDQANNTTPATTTVVPAAAPTGHVARTGSPPLLSWRRIRGARYYNVQLFRGRHKVLSAWPVKTRMQLRKRWRFHGRRYKLTRGRYHWYVWPGYGTRAARRYGTLVRKGTFYFRP